DDGHRLLDDLVAGSGATVRVERFDGHMGMRNLNHVLVHLRNNAVRRRGALGTETVLISERAPFLREIPDELASLFDVVPQAAIRDRLEIEDDGYLAVLSDRKGCANSGLLVQQVLAAIEARYPDRLRYHDRTA